MPQGSHRPISPEVAAALADLSLIPANLQNLKAAGRVLVPALSRAIALLPDGKVETTEGVVFKAAGGHDRTEILICEDPSDGREGVPLVHVNSDKYWALFRMALPEIVETLMQDRKVQAVSDPRLAQLAEFFVD